VVLALLKLGAVDAKEAGEHIARLEARSKAHKRKDTAWAIIHHIRELRDIGGGPTVPEGYFGKLLKLSETPID
jgi:hypothetical protein